MEDRTITITTEEGKEILCDILFTYYSEEFKKDYIVFTDREEQVTSAAIINSKGDGKGELVQITSEEEWKMLENVLNDYNNKAQENCSGNCSSCQGNCSCDQSECDCDGNCECKED